MYNRQPTPGQEGMVTITLDDGRVLRGRIEMADNPLHEGTPLTVETLLKHTTGALYGLPESAVPDDVLAFLGKYNQHWWLRRYNSSHYEPDVGTAEVHAVTYAGGSIEYSDRVSVDSEGTISLVNPTTLYVNGSADASFLSVLSGKYFILRKNQYTPSGYPITKLNEPYFVPQNTSDYKSIRDDGVYAYLFTCAPVTATWVDGAGEWEHVQSSDRSAYPDSGESGGFEWWYLGVPFENAATAPKIETVSYVGTGVSGLANANSVTFKTPPILMAFVNDKGALISWVSTVGDIAPICFPFLLTTEYQMYGLFTWSAWEDDYGGGKGFWAKKSADGRTISWYSNSYHPNNQLNNEGTTYNVVALCLGG